MKKSYPVLLVFAIVFLTFAFVLSLKIGHFPISLSEFIEILKYKTGFGELNISLDEVETLSTVFFEIRLPRIIAALLVGASLSVSGAVYQGMFVNPLVSPSILGVLSGAAFGAALGMVFKFPAVLVQLNAFIFAFLAVFCAIFISRMYGRGNSILMLVLGGIISSSLFGALLSFLKFIADPYGVLQSIVFWLMGTLSLATKTNVEIAAPIMLISIVLMFIFSKYIDVLSLGEDEAKALGVDVEKVRLFIILLATLLSALSVMLAGMVGWIGLVIPHIARFIVGVNHIKLIPFCVILGAGFILVIDTISRSAFTVEIPLGILTSVLGIPMFIYVLSKHRLRDK
ncbi:MAG: FecCD family ABC transporter permease [Campylobacteraceae bacterium]